MYWQDESVQIIMEHEESQLHFYMEGNERTLCELRGKIYYQLEDLHNKINISGAEFLLVIKNQYGIAEYSYRDLLTLEEMGVSEFPLPACRSVELVSDYVKFFLKGRGERIMKTKGKEGNNYFEIHAENVGQIGGRQVIKKDLNIGNKQNFVEPLVNELKAALEKQNELEEKYRKRLLEEIEKMHMELTKEPKKSILEKWKERLSTIETVLNVGTSLGAILANYILLAEN